MLLAQKGRLDLDRLWADARALLTEASYRDLVHLIDEFG